MSKERFPFVVTEPDQTPYTTDGAGNFQYKPPNNSGTVLGIIGAAVSTVGDALQTIGAIIQLNTDNSSDYQSQVDDFKSDQETEKMQKQIDDLTETVKKLERMIRNNQK